MSDDEMNIDDGTVLTLLLFAISMFVPSVGGVVRKRGRGFQNSGG